jgi:hypothetical protein
MLAGHYPFRLTLRHAQGRVRFADRSLAPLFASSLVHCVRPRREFAPAGDQLSCVDKKVGKETTLPTRPSLREGYLALLGLCGSGRTHYAACGRCVLTAARSQLLRRAVARSRKALCCSARPKGESNTRLGSLRIGLVACGFWSKASIPQPERGERVRRTFAYRPFPASHYLVACPRSLRATNRSCTPPPVRAEVSKPLAPLRTPKADAKRGVDRVSCEATTVLLLGPF